MTAMAPKHFKPTTTFMEMTTNDAILFRMSLKGNLASTWASAIAAVV
jgi:hypothetical protein